jgi:hypothetical protein
MYSMRVPSVRSKWKFSSICPCTGDYAFLSLCHKFNFRRPIFSCQWFHRLTAHFSTSYGCSSKLVWKKCDTYVTVWTQADRRCGAVRHGNCKSCGGSCAPVRSFPTPGRLPLFSTLTDRCLDACTSHYIGTTSDCRTPQSSSARKIVRHCEFSEKLGILEKHHVSNDATKNVWFLSNLICLRGNGP